MFNYRKKIYYSIIYSLLAIMVIGFTFIFPIVKVFEYAFKDLRGVEAKFVGINNFVTLFKDQVFIDSLIHNFIILLSVPITIILALFFAIILFEKLAGWKFYRFVIFLPYVLSITVIGVIFSYLFQKEGAINEFFRLLHLNFLIKDWIGSSNLSLWTIIFVMIWKDTGLGFIIIFARLLSIEKQLYEAADLDGVNWFQKHFYITLPQTKNIIGFLLIFYIINRFSWIFVYIYVMTMGGPSTSTYIAEYYIYNKGFIFNNYSLASSAAVVLLLTVLIFVILNARLQKFSEVE